MPTALLQNRAKWLLSTLGGFVVAYCLAVLWYVATTPDVGLRCLLISEPTASAGRETSGLEIRRVVAQDEERGWPRLAPGDRLLELAGRPAGTFVHFTRALMWLRTAELPPGGPGVSESAMRDQAELLPPFVDVEGQQQWVKAKALHEGKPVTTWLPLHSIPWQDVAQTFIWFLLEFGIFTVGALALWSRPFDRQARVFFAMCIVTLGGFVGGYHWWLIAGSIWLTVPFIVCAMLVPVITLHFFLIYPEPKPPLSRHPNWTVVAIYAIPAAWMAVLVALAIYSSVLFEWGAPEPQIDAVLKWLNDGIYVYLAIAAAYFLATLLALANSFLTTRNPILHNQVKWILWAAVVATAPVGYSLYLAHFEKERFALGSASFPMFTASLLFMLAYAVGILRYKLMLVDQMVSRGMAFYILSLLVTVGFSLAIASVGFALAIASTTLVAIYQQAPMARQMPLAIGLAIVAVLLLNWLRERLQQLIDRKFFREKFQLDKALQWMNDAAGRPVDARELAQRMLASCRDLLGVDRAALYLRDANDEVFRLCAAEGLDTAPLQFSTDQQLLGLLHEDASLQRVDAETGEEADSETQMLLRRLDVELVHALEVDGRLAGALMLGVKRAGSRYTAEDLALLASVSQITGVALQGARVHEAAARLNEELRLKIEKINEQQRLISMLQAEITSRGQVEPAAEGEPFRRDLIKGSSLVIRQVLDTVRKVSGSQSSVLVRGESGTGKELLALAIHDNSPRRQGPMISVHCGALAPGLLESELFGHVKGAFTGAHRDKVGRFELANGGTLFLDEIGDISLETQIKLLRVLQEREFEPVGGTRTVRVDVRLIAATHQNLERLITDGRFREDLFYRLNVISIVLPPLRERGDDILELALHFLTRAVERAGKQITHFDDAAIESLRRYPWPGNIRELENAVERAVVMAEGPAITIHDLPAEIVLAGGPGLRGFDSGPERVGLPRPALTGALARDFDERGAVPANGAARRRHLEKQRLLDALLRCGGNKAEAARLLGVPRSTFFSRLKKHGVE